MLIPPATAADLLGVSRQAVVKQRGRLDHSGQARREGGRWMVESTGLFDWWVGHCRVGPTWSKVGALRKILGDQAEAVLLELGGAATLDALVMLMPHRDWLIGTNDDGLPVGGPPDGPLIPLPHLWRVMCEAMEALPEGAALDLEAMEVVGADGQVIGPWEVRL